MNTDQLGILLEELYKRVPDVKCKGLCAEACGPIRMSQLEFERIVAELGEEPEWPTSEEHVDCPLLDAKQQCTVYGTRPMLCRLWGAVRNKLTRCPHGCKPKRWLSTKEGHDLLLAAQLLVPGQKRRSFHKDFDEGRLRRG